MSDFFGWDMIYKLSEHDLKKNEDVLTLFVHFAMIKAGYKCIGLGEDQTLSGNEVSSETLPTGWNDGTIYSIRYFINDILYVLKGITVDNNVLYNLLKMGSGTELKVTNVTFNFETSVAALKGNLSTLIPSHEEVFKKIQTELLAPMGGGNTKEATTQSDKTLLQRCTSDGEPRRRGPDAHVNPIWADPDRDPLRVGQSDLDPFGRGGGMLFDPFSGRRAPFDPSAGLIGPPLPRGAVPPGARFDPFGPFMPQQPRPRGPPDGGFDPPGFGNMFM